MSNKLNSLLYLINEFIKKNCITYCIKFKSHFYLQKQTKIKVNNIEINYLKVGNGPQTLLLLPGALGTLAILSILELIFKTTIKLNIMHIGT